MEYLLMWIVVPISAFFPPGPMKTIQFSAEGDPVFHNEHKTYQAGVKHLSGEKKA
jgi:hypothetical protein